MSQCLAVQSEDQLSGYCEDHTVKCNTEEKRNEKSVVQTRERGYDWMGVCCRKTCAMCDAPAAGGAGGEGGGMNTMMLVGVGVGAVVVVVGAVVVHGKRKGAL